MFFIVFYSRTPPVFSILGARCVEQVSVPTKFECVNIKRYTWLPAKTYRYTPDSWTPYKFTYVVEVRAGATAGWGSELRWPRMLNTGGP